MKTKVLTLEERGCGLGRKKRTKVHCLSANPSSPSHYLSKQLQDMDFVPVVVVMVVEELEHLKILLVLTYSGTEGNSLTPIRSLEIPSAVQTHSFLSLFYRNSQKCLLGAAQACWKCSRMRWTEMCLSKIF